jgi:hypothetical protein
VHRASKAAALETDAGAGRRIGSQYEVVFAFYRTPMMRRRERFLRNP